MKKVTASATFALISVGDSRADTNTLGRLRKRALFEESKDENERFLRLSTLEKQLAIERRHDIKPLERDVVGNDFFNNDPTRQPTLSPTIAPTVVETPAPSGAITTPTVPSDPEPPATAPTSREIPTESPVGGSPVTIAPTPTTSSPGDTPAPTVPSGSAEPTPVGGDSTSAPSTASPGGTLSPTSGGQPTVPGSLESSPFFPLASAITESATITLVGTPQNRALETLIETNPEFDPVLDSFQILQKYSLNTLFYSTGGETWADSTGWTEATSPCEWVGLSCDDNLEVVGIDLASNDLIGGLPSEVRALTPLRKLCVIICVPSGASRARVRHFSQICNTFLLSYLFSAESLNLTDNSINGPIAGSIGELFSLTSMNLAGNFLQEAIPSSIGNLAFLESLNLGSNQLTGTIPSEVGTLQLLTSFVASGNAISGSIPSEFGNMFSLGRLWNCCTGVCCHYEKSEIRSD